MELKGIEKLNKVISNQLKSFGVDGAFLNDEFCMLFENDKVGYALTYSIIDKWFNEYVEQAFGYTVEYTFIISLLHEIGHYKTIDDLTDGQYSRCLKKKKDITKALEKKNLSEEKEKELNFKYFSLKDEFFATSWAVDYMEKHPKKVKKMWQRIYPAIIEFYNENGLDKKPT